MLPVAIYFSTWKVVVETFCPVLYLLDKTLHQVFQFSTVYVMAQTQPPASLVVYHLAPSVNIGFLPYLLRNCLKKWYSTRERSSHVRGAWPDTYQLQVHMQSTASSHDRLSEARSRRQISP